MLWLWFRVSLMRWAAYLGWLLRSSHGSGAIRPVLRLDSNKRPSKPKPTSTGPYNAAIWLMPMLLLSGFAGCATSPPPAHDQTRGCFRWIMGNEQEVYVYENGHLLARLDAEAGDVYVKNWCLLKFSTDIGDETRRFLR